ncbi:STAS domain-containing protein [Streptomyces leeuwenhoekii]|uniref:Anti-sigma factor antagonist n=2 Tax=Streptomyces leeuwenhoekii TaxID=1437453 RepID=A0A0F7VKL8_STRLW|nr:STAS domain-containing protein [Streptomyces leeuwenhoekii]CQR59329.1 Anti-sigma F factor antagonist (spoIIAA-2); Anti-sigma B factor antagonist RsbV [Streptomyces leeuwenhoekii]
MVTVQMRHSDVTVARLPDVVAFDTIPELRPQLLALLEESTCRHLVLDLSHIDYFDSSGLALLLGIWQRSQTGGTTLTLAAPPPLVSRMLNITQAVTVLTVAPSVREALRTRPRTRTDGAQAADQE